MTPTSFRSPTPPHVILFSFFLFLFKVCLFLATQLHINNGQPADLECLRKKNYTLDCSVMSGRLVFYSWLRQGEVYFFSQRWSVTVWHVKNPAASPMPTRHPPFHAAKPKLCGMKAVKLKILVIFRLILSMF